MYSWETAEILEKRLPWNRRRRKDTILVGCIIKSGDERKTSERIIEDYNIIKHFKMILSHTMEKGNAEDILEIADRNSQSVNFIPLTLNCSRLCMYKSVRPASPDFQTCFDARFAPSHALPVCEPSVLQRNTTCFSLNYTWQLRILTELHLHYTEPRHVNWRRLFCSADV